MSDETSIRMTWFSSTALRGVKLWVKQEDVETAMELLKEEPLKESKAESVEE